MMFHAAITTVCCVLLCCSAYYLSRQEYDLGTDLTTFIDTVFKDADLQALLALQLIQTS